MTPTPRKALMTALDDTRQARSAPARTVDNALLNIALAGWRLPWVDAPARRLGLTPFTHAHLTRRFLGHLRESRSGRPVYVRTPAGVFLVPLRTTDAIGLVAGAEEHGGPGPVTCLTGAGARVMALPHAPVRPLSEKSPGEAAGTAVAEAADSLLAAHHVDSTVTWPEWTAAMNRLSRHIVLGVDAAPDTLLSGILDATADAGDPRSYVSARAALRRRLLPYLRTSRPDGPLTNDADAAAHLLALVTRAVTETAARALSRVADQPPASAGARARVAVRSALLDVAPVFASVHRVRAPFLWNGELIEPGTDVLYLASWLREVEDEDHGATGLCTSPGPCRSADLAVCVAEDLVEALVGRFGGAVRVGSGAETSASDRGRAVARSGAPRLAEHAGALADLARDPGWNHDALGERCRMTLLAQAERCSRAAADMRRAAGWLAL